MWGSSPGKCWQFPRNSCGVGQFARKMLAVLQELLWCGKVPQENAGSSPGTLVVWGSSPGKCWQFPRNSYGVGQFPRAMLAVLQEPLWRGKVPQENTGSSLETPEVWGNST